jgi:hypothetical protein
MKHKIEQQGNKFILKAKRLFGWEEIQTFKSIRRAKRKQKELEGETTN